MADEFTDKLLLASSSGWESSIGMDPEIPLHVAHKAAVLAVARVALQRAAEAIHEARRGDADVGMIAAEKIVRALIPTEAT